MSVALRVGADRVIRAVSALSASNPVILIDGFSGAGKSSLAADLVARWPLRDRVQCVALDSLYPGWGGLDAGTQYAREHILVPHGRGTVGFWQRWDWERGERAESSAVHPSLPLIVEGSGIITAATAGLADIRVWVDSPEASRKPRALDRDGDVYRPHWDAWAVQERAHFRTDHPQDRATITVTVP